MSATAPGEKAPSTSTATATSETERRVGLVRGTRDWLPADFARLAALERTLLDRFARAGYKPARTPVLELTDLHDRKSGAGIVAKLFDVSGAGTLGVCLRPELTAGVVRAYAEADEPPPLPWRASVSGPVFRYLPTAPGLDREFVQTGVELLGAGGAAADAEVVWLADWSLRALGVQRPKIRVGHVGLILELLNKSGLPAAASSTLLESLSEAASEGKNVRTLETALDRLTAWLGSNGPEEDGEDVRVSTLASGVDPAVDRLFHHLVPDVAGRRSGREVLERLRRKWSLGRSLKETLAKVRGEIHTLADLRGPILDVLKRLDRDYAALAPESVASIREFAAMLEAHGVELDRVELDLGFGRGIGFYTRMIFELLVETPEGDVEVCGGGRYDGLARVLGSDRDDRGAGFAFGLERLDRVLGGRTPADDEPRGFLVVGADDRANAREAAALAAFLRDRLDLPVVLSGLPFDEAVLQARASGLDRIVAVGSTIEVWDLRSGDVRRVEEDELIGQLRARLSVVRGGGR